MDACVDTGIQARIFGFPLSSQPSMGSLIAGRQMTATETSGTRIVAKHLKAPCSEHPSNHLSHNSSSPLSRTHTHSHSLTHTQSDTPTRTHIHSQTHTHTRTYTPFTLSHTISHPHTLSHALTHRHTHTHLVIPALTFAMVSVSMKAVT